MPESTEAPKDDAHVPADTRTQALEDALNDCLCALLSGRGMPHMGEMTELLRPAAPRLRARAASSDARHAPSLIGDSREVVRYKSAWEAALLESTRLHRENEALRERLDDAKTQANASASALPE